MLSESRESEGESAVKDEGRVYVYVCVCVIGR